VNASPIEVVVVGVAGPLALAGPVPSLVQLASIPQVDTITSNATLDREFFNGVYSGVLFSKQQAQGTASPQGFTQYSPGLKQRQLPAAPGPPKKIP
jgi:hypothetical protein